MIPWYLMAKGKGGGGYKTASGPIVSVSDALAAPLRSLLVNIEPVQEGTGDPSPDNVRPISGWTGCNVVRSGLNLVDTSDITDYSKWSSTVATEGDMPSNFANLIYTLPVTLKAGLDYTLNVDYSDTNFPTYLYFGYYKGNVATRITYITTNTAGRHSYTFTAIDGVNYCFRMGSTEVLTQFNEQVAKILGIQIEQGSTAHDVEQPHIQTLPITWQSAGTVYGGTLDVTTGALTVERTMVDLGYFTWLKSGSGTGRFYCSPGKEYLPYKYDQSTDMLCSGYDFDGYGDNTKGYYGANGTLRYFYHIGSRLARELYIVDEAKATMTAADFTTAMSGVQLVYELATPITIPLSPTEISTLQGQNNVWADTGDVTVEYLSAGGDDPDLMKLAVAFMGRR